MREIILNLLEMIPEWIWFALGGLVGLMLFFGILLGVQYLETIF